MSMVQVTEDQTYVFKASDFTTGTLAAVKITTLPTTGTLYDKGVAVTLTQTISASDISAGNFTFVPNTDVTVAGSFNDTVYTSSNGETTGTASSTTLNVTADAGPSASGGSVQATANQTYIFKTSDFGYSDSADKTSDPLGSVTITSLPADGTLYYKGTAITTTTLGTTGYQVSASDIASGYLTFVPTSGSGSFSFKVT